MKKTLPTLIASLLLCCAVPPAAAASTNEADLIKGIRTNALFGALPDPVAGFAITDSSSDPNRHTLRARYEHRDGDAAAVVNIRAVRAAGKIVELPDGPDSPAVGVNNVIQHHKRDGGEVEPVELTEASGQAMNCVTVKGADQPLVRLVCRTAVHGRMIESQADARVAEVGETVAMDRLRDFTQELFSSVRAIEAKDR